MRMGKHGVRYFPPKYLAWALVYVNAHVNYMRATPRLLGQRRGRPTHLAMEKDTHENIDRAPMVCNGRV